MKALVAAAALAILLAAGWVWWQAGPPSEEAEPVRMTVERGTSVRALGGRLAESGVIRSPVLFEVWLRARGDAGRIQAGTYSLPRDRSLPAIVDLLVDGQTLLTSVTVPEGYRLEQTAAVVAATLPFDSAAFVAAVTDPALVDSLLPRERVGADVPSLEGYLYPETYRVDPGTGERELARLMVEQFWRTVGPVWRARADSLGRPVHEIVTLASIVEEEARVPEERTVIAGVFWNRLEIGMRLEADPTVQYALGGHKDRVLYRDLEVESPYNTYQVAGLPPGPISSPGGPAIEATLWPDSVPYLYFFATGEGGRHTFSETFAEHNRKRRELGR